MLDFASANVVCSLATRNL